MILLTFNLRIVIICSVNCNVIIADCRYIQTLSLNKQETPLPYHVNIQYIIINKYVCIHRC